MSCYQCMTCFISMIHAILVNQCMWLIYACCAYYRLILYATHVIGHWYNLWIDDASFICYWKIMYSMHANDPWYLLWIYSISYRSLMCVVHISDQLWMLHMPSIDACYTCHHLCRNFNGCLFLCYDLWLLCISVFWIVGVCYLYHR